MEQEEQEVELAKPKPFKALLLDERDVLRGVVDIADEAQLTPLHVDLRPHGGECDRKPGEYRWDREKKCLMPLPKLQRAKEGRPSIEMALAFDLLARNAADPKALPEVVLAWLDDAVQSVDMAAYAASELVAAYARSRGLPEKKGA